MQTTQQMGREIRDTLQGNGPEHMRHREGPIAKGIEEYTARVPSDTFLWAAGLSILGSVSLWASGNRHSALFVGQWVAPFLVLGVYNKIVKVAGPDRVSGSQRPGFNG